MLEQQLKFRVRLKPQISMSVRTSSITVVKIDMAKLEVTQGVNGMCISCLASSWVSNEEGNTYTFIIIL